MTVSRREAIRLIEAGHARIEELLERVPARARTHPGVGGGTWSPKDLVGHLASWEERACEALDAWDRGEPAPIDRLLRSRSLSSLNAGWVEEKGPWTWARTRGHAAEAHTRLLDAIREMPDDRWQAPATPRGRKPLGGRLGSILGGPAGPFRHADAHVESLMVVVGPARGRRGLDRTGAREPGTR
jgi:DinB superfamily